MRPRIPASIVRVGNVYVEFLRTYAHAYHTQADIERAFARWLLQSHPRSYLVYCTTTVWSRR